METKQYLKQINRLDRQIQNKLSEIHRLRTMACNVGISDDSERVQTSGTKDRIGNIVSRIVDMEHEVDNMVDKRFDIVSQIDNMEDTDFYDILSQVYVLKKEMKVIAIDKKMSYSNMKRLHVLALEEFEKKYGEKYLEVSLDCAK